METRHKAKLKERMKKRNHKWIAEVDTEEDGLIMTSEFNSDLHTLENVLHCIELNLMTYLNNSFESPIKVTIRRLEE